MATTITMPQLGETVTEGTVAQWLKKVGDHVEKYEAFLEVSTDKVNAEVPSPVTGVIKEVLVKEGDTVPVGTAIAVIEEVGAATAATPAVPADASVPQTRDQMAASANLEPVPGFNIPQLETTPAKPTNGHSRSENVIPSSYGAPGGLANDAAGAEEALRKASPAVRKLAREHHIDIRALTGSGANGRVTADDVLSAARMGPAAAVGQAIAAGTNFGATPPPSFAPSAPPSGMSSYADPIPGTMVPLTQARRIIAERMVESIHTAPHAWTMTSIDVTGVWKWRAREKDRFERETGYKLTLLPFFIRAVVESLSAFPLMNARFTPSTGSGQAGIYVNKDVNIGIAIGLPATLVVPVVKNADKLSIKGLAIAAGELIDKARRGKLGADDLAGGTFTVNNNGANGSWASAPILNAGQAGIVTMETVEKKLVVRDDDSFAPRYVMNSCLSLDHRVVDGYVASGFLADLKKRIERMTPDGAL